MFLSDMSMVWKQVLDGLREGGYMAALTACEDIGDIEFTSQEIKLYVKDIATCNVLNKYIDVIKKLAGGDYIDILYKRRQAQKHENRVS